MKLPLRMSLVAKRPRPVFERPTRNGRRELVVLDMMVTRASPLWTSTRASSALACYAGLRSCAPSRQQQIAPADVPSAALLRMQERDQSKAYHVRSYAQTS